MTTLHTKGFKVAGIVEPSNIYSIAKSKAEISLAALLDVEDADAWDTKLSNDNKALTTIQTCMTLHRTSLNGT